MCAHPAVGRPLQHGIRLVEGVVGVQRTLGVVSPQSPGDGHTYTFSHWGHTTAPTHIITTPPLATTFTANYVCNVIETVDNMELRLEPSGDLRITWTPPVDCLTSGSPHYRVYEASTRLPTVMPGSFPDDPPYTVIGETDTTTFFTPAGMGVRYFLVEPIGSDGNPGPVGHYDQ